MTLFDTGIRPAIDEYLAKKAEQKRDYGELWSGSSAGYCMRLNILKRLNIEPVPEMADDTARTIRVFESGHLFHEWVQRITEVTGLSVAQELELIDNDLMVKGHCDDIIKRDTLILYDYKTVNSQAFNFKRDEIGYYHSMQLATYLYMLRKLDGYKDLSEARILQISKDDLRMREQQLIYTPALEKKIVGYWRTLQGYWKTKTLPRCTCLDFDGGFMGKRSQKGKIYNPYFRNDEPCSLAWVKDKLPEGWDVH